MTGNDNPIRHIADRIFGSQTRMAQAINRPQQTVATWVSEGRVPSRRIPEIIAAAEQLSPSVHLRADHFFGLEPVPAQASAA